MLDRFAAEVFGLLRVARWEWDLARDEVRLSPELCALFGVPEENATRDLLLSQLHEADIARGRRHFWPLLESSLDQRVEFRLARGGYLRGVTRVTHDGQGRAVRVVGLCQDVSEEKASFVAAQKEAQDRFDASKLVTVLMLLRGLGHEINNPNGLILLGINLLRDAWEAVIPVLDEYHEREGDFLLAGLTYEQMRAEVPRLAEDILGAAERIRKLVSDLRQYTRLISMEPWADVALNDIVLAAHAKASEGRGSIANEIETQLAERLPPVYGNAERLAELVAQLIVNAMESCKRPDLRVQVRTLPGLEAGTVRVEVEDNGDGIAEEDLPHITDPFFTTKRAQGHSGLGLAIASALVREFNGELIYDSRIGIGTRATLVLPSRDEGALGTLGTLG